MRQLALDWGPAKPQTLATFVAGQNIELVDALQRFAQRSSNVATAYIWGEPGAGKTHLLQALGAGPRTRYIGAEAPDANFAHEPEVDLYLLDDCERLDADRQVDAFALFNQVREHGAFMVCAGNAPPAALNLREDLRTRLGWGLIYQVRGLSDEEKIAALTQAAAERGLVLSNGVLPYLLSHFQRDMRTLSAMLDALDRYSLETQRPITLPLLRSLLQLENETKT